MLDALTARSTGPRPVAASGPPSGVTVVDTSDTEASVAWEAVANSEAYRVYRAAQNGSFALLSGPSNMYHDETVGQHFKSYHNKVSKSGLNGCYVALSRVSNFADSRLSASTPYSWRVSAVVGGVEGAASAIVTASTRMSAPVCAHPGSC
jgi:hypothetical protein